MFKVTILGKNNALISYLNKIPLKDYVFEYDTLYRNEPEEGDWYYYTSDVIVLTDPAQQNAFTYKTKVIELFNEKDVQNAISKTMQLHNDYYVNETIFGESNHSEFESLVDSRY